MKSLRINPLLIPASVLLMLCVHFSAFPQEIKNGYYVVKFNKNTGFLSAEGVNGQPVFTGGVNGVNFNDHCYLSENINYRFAVRSSHDKDNNPELFIKGIDKNSLLNFEKHIRLKGKSVQLEVVYKNVSRKEIHVGSIDPLRLIRDKSGILYYTGAEKCLTNGAMYYDAGIVQNLDKPFGKSRPYGEAKGGIMIDTVLKKDLKTVESWWNICLFNDYSNEAMSIGYLNNRNSLGRLQVLKEGANELSLVIESVFNPGFILKPGQSISSDKCVILLENNPYSALEGYADLMSAENSKPEMSVVNGWCSWFYTLDLISEDEVLANARFASEHLKKYGLEYIQIDEGYQKHHGDWTGNSRFPHGLKWLNEQIKLLGLKPGIWISPFVISEETALYKTHPDWIVKDKTGNPLRIGPWPNTDTDWYKNETPKRYCLDITNPGAKKWFVDLFDTLVNNWGYEMIKIDFVAWTVFSVPEFHDRTVTPAQIYYEAIQSIREVAGEKCIILDCGPGNITAGSVNSMRIEYDQNYGDRENAWRQYFGGSSSSAGAAAKRYYFHNKLWVNDIDHVCTDLLSIRNSQAVATLIGLSGGNTISGDRLMNLSPSKIEILKKIFPATLENARPVDLLESEPQTSFSCKINRSFGSWDLLAFFNPDMQNSVTRHFDFARLLLDSTKTYICFDFWNETLTGEISKSLNITIDPGSVALYSIHEKTGYPQFISTNRHIKQGAVEIEDTKFDTKSNILSGISVSPPGTSHSIFIYLPEGYVWAPSNSKVFEYHKDYTIRYADSHLIRVDLNFETSGKVEWEIKFEK